VHFASRLWDEIFPIAIRQSPNRSRRGVTNMEILRIHRIRCIAPFATVILFTAVASVYLPPAFAQEAIPQQAPAIQPKNLPTDAANQSLSYQALSTMPPEDLGDLMMVRKRYEAAIQAYLQTSPKSAAVWNKLGIGYQQMYNTELARKSYKESLRIDSKNPNVINNLGTIYYSLRQYDVAERYYRKALKIDKRSALIYKNLGTDLLAEDQFKKGWECYQTALAIDPDIFERTNQLRIGEPTPSHKIGAMNYFLARSYAGAGMTDLAVEYLRKAIDEGFTDRKKILADKEFASLHGHTAFERLLAEQRTQ